MAEMSSSSAAGTSFAQPLGSSAPASLALQLAAQVGDAGRDSVRVSYTSLFIALLWLGDDVSVWLESTAKELGAHLDVIYQTRGVDPSQRSELVERAHRESDAHASMSPSAQRVTGAAAAIARETHDAEAVTTRHLLAVYLFRNPPDHERQLEHDWGFALPEWRLAFADFVAAEADKWRDIIAPHVDPLLLEHQAALISERYDFDPEALAVMDRWRALSSSTKSGHSYLRSKELFTALNEGSGWDGQRAAATTAAIQHEPVALSAGGRHVLDGAQSLAVTTTGSEQIHARHLEAAVLLVKDSSGHRAAASTFGNLSRRKRSLFEQVTRSYLDDNSTEWKRALLGEREPDLTAFRRDDPSEGSDDLDVERYARALALLIASVDVKPPLSIGISGDWGSGKSFFMRLMREATAKITTKTKTDPRFHTHVVPICFNAWHYAEKNLLASLVQTIFLGLRTGLELEPGEDAATTKLRAAKQDLVKATAEVSTAKELVQATTERVNTLENQVAVQLSEVKLGPSDLADVAVDRLRGHLTTLGLTDLDQALSEGEAKVGQVADVIQRVNAESLRGRSLLAKLERMPIAWGWVVVGFLLLGSGLLLVALFPEGLGRVLTVSATLLAELGTGIAWANNASKRFGAGLDELETVQTSLATKLENKRAKVTQELDGAKQTLEDQTNALTEAEQRANALNEAVTQAQAETESLNLLARLVNDGITTRKYEQHLGLVAAARADFDDLSRLLAKATQEAVKSSARFRNVDRIVLYIDDLDRCPTETVVLVLETIHLLLAVDLFVVVVGLDVRWATHALEEKYQRQLSTPGGATALDYLEKIFQVPFWLSPMNETASRTLLGKMLPAATKKQSLATPHAALTQQTQAAGTSNGATDTTGTAQPEHVAAPKVPETELLTLEPLERNFILQLAPAVSRSPRRLKRFVNTYLLLRASLTAEEREVFALNGGKSGTYREALLLLAILTTVPRAWRRMVDCLTAESLPVDLAALRAQANSGLAGDELAYCNAAFAIYGSGDLSAMRDMIPIVARFSFHRLST